MDELHEGEYCPQCLAEYITECWDKPIEETEYRGRKVQLGKPFLTPDGPKKRAVYVRNNKGNVVKVDPDTGTVFNLVNGLLATLGSLKYAVMIVEKPVATGILA